MILNVPYYSQHLDVTDAFWQERACAIACLKMQIEGLGGAAPDLDTMIARGDALGARHPEHGSWLHNGLVQLASEYGTELRRGEWRKSDTQTLEELNEVGIRFLESELRAGRPVIISSIKKFTEADKFHMVILVGFEEGEQGVRGFYYHDPDSHNEEDGKGLFIDLETFKKTWRRMAIFSA